MPEIEDSSIEIMLVCDVLEHVPNVSAALGEIHRTLRLGGYVIVTVPQKDGLASTFEDPTMKTPGERKVTFGQWDHPRIFGDDFPEVVGSSDFSVSSVDDSFFLPNVVERYVLVPPFLSEDPLATNHRKIFFCQKQA